jgi:cytosine/uracil/thiamine/allantoin permease
MPNQPAFKEKDDRETVSTLAVIGLIALLISALFGALGESKLSWGFVGAGVGFLLVPLLFVIWMLVKKFKGNKIP